MGWDSLGISYPVYQAFVNVLGFFVPTRQLWWYYMYRHRLQHTNINPEKQQNTSLNLNNTWGILIGIMNEYMLNIMKLICWDMWWPIKEYKRNVMDDINIDHKNIPLSEKVTPICVP